MKREEIVDYTKKNVASIVGIAVFVTSIVGGTIVVEDRYAKASELQVVRNEQTKAVDELYKRQLEDKLFELRLRPNPSQAEIALIKRYEQQLREVTLRLNPR